MGQVVFCNGHWLISTIVPSYVPSKFRCFNRLVRWFIFWKCATNFWLLGLGKSARYLPLWVRFIPSKTAGNSSKEVVMCIKIVEQGIFYPNLFDSYVAMWYKYRQGKSHLTCFFPHPVQSIVLIWPRY